VPTRLRYSTQYVRLLSCGGVSPPHDLSVIYGYCLCLSHYRFVFTRLSSQFCKESYFIYVREGSTSSERRELRSVGVAIRASRGPYYTWSHRGGILKIVNSFLRVARVIHEGAVGGKGLGSTPDPQVSRELITWCRLSCNGGQGCLSGAQARRGLRYH